MDEAEARLELKYYLQSFQGVQLLPVISKRVPCRSKNPSFRQATPSGLDSQVTLGITRSAEQMRPYCYVAACCWLLGGASLAKFQAP